MPTYDANGALLVSGAAIGSFIGLTDTPAAYAGNALRVLAVNATPDAVIFAGELYWDDVNDWLGVGITPTSPLHVHQPGGNVAMRLASGAAGSQVQMRVEDAAQSWQFRKEAGHNLVIRDGTAGAIAVTIIPSTLHLGINTTPQIQVHVADDDAATNTVVPVARLESQVSGGVGAAGHGPGLEFTGESSTTEDTSMGEVAARWSVATHASRRARIELRAAYIGTDVLVGVVEAPATGSADGNSRGVGAVDLQGYRGAVTDVASGDYATISGGRDNEASGDRSSVPGGAGALADKYGQFAHAAGEAAAIGDAQRSAFVARRDIASHTLNTWFSLWLDGASIQMVIAASSAWTFRALVVGITANSAQQFSYEVVGLIERDAANNTTLAASTTTTIFESDANYDCQAVADDANEALEIQVRRTGGVDYSIQWVAVIHTVECIHT